MNKKLEKILDGIVLMEGGYVNHPNDRGGPTNYGITLDTLSAFRGKRCTTDELKKISPSDAKEIYFQYFLVKNKLHLLIDEIQHFMLDSCVHHGPYYAVLMLQSVVNQFGISSVFLDGNCGPKTRQAVSDTFDIVGEKWFMLSLIEERRMKFIGIVEKDSTQKVFLNGWLNRLLEFENEYIQ